MELTFCIEALILLCSVLVARKVLITYQCLGYCWAVFAQHQGCLSNIAPSPSRLGLGKTLGGDTVRTADPNWEKGHSIPYKICSAIKDKSKEEDLGEFVIMTFVFWNNLYGTKALLPRKWLDIACLWEVESKIFCFPLLPHKTFAFALLNCLYFDPQFFFPSYILPSCPAEEGSDRMAWWAPGTQPGSTHHRTKP